MNPLWKPNEKFVGTCMKCGVQGLKRNMTSLYVKENGYAPMRILCHLCPKCYVDVIDSLAVAVSR